MTDKRKRKITLDPRNARTHSDRNKEAAEKSLRELGVGRSIVVDRDKVTIGGALIYEKAMELGIPVEEIHTEGDKLIVVVRDDLGTDDPRRKALALADNQIGTLAEWDELVLEELQTELLGEIELDVMGFDEPKGWEPKEDGQDLSDGVETENECPKCGYRW